MKSICGTSGTMTVFLILKISLTIIAILIPIIIIINGSINMFKAVKTGKEEDIKNSGKQLVKNIIAGLIVFAIPSLFSFVFSNLLNESGEELLTCIDTASIQKVNSLKEEERQQRMAEKKAEDQKVTDEANRRTAEEKERNDSIPEEKKRNPSYNENNNTNPAGVTGNAWVNNLLSQAKEITDYVRINNFNYGDAPVNPAINHDAKLVSCDRCVGWFLYNVGYTDQPESHGIGVGVMPNWLEKQGFQKITNQSEIKAGDVIFVNPNSNGVPQHVFLLGNPVGNGVWERYDCGSVNRIRLTGQYSSYSSQPFHESIGNFMYAYRSPNAN